MFAATIGFFDGVHQGHQKVIERLKSVASNNDMKTMVVTFGNHPMEIVHPGYQPELLTSVEEKVNRIKACGVDEVVVLQFTREMMQQPAREFMEKTLRNTLHVSALVIGYDNRFGRRNPEETFETYRQYGAELGIDVIEGPRPEECGLFEGKPVSSSLIRQLIADGRNKEAHTLLELRQ